MDNFDTYQEQALVTSWTSVAGQFGEDLGPPIFTEQAPAPGPRSTAVRTAREYRRHTAERRRAEDLELIQVAAREQQEDEALAFALHRFRKGGKIPTGTRILARAALQRRGYTQGSTSERLAAMAGQGHGWRPTEER